MVDGRGQAMGSQCAALTLLSWGAFIEELPTGRSAVLVQSAMAVFPPRADLVLARCLRGTKWGNFLPGLGWRNRFIAPFRKQIPSL
jgi:hypothetical protein